MITPPRSFAGPSAFRSKLAAIKKANVRSVTDGEMIEQSNAEQFPGLLEPTRDGAIFNRRLRVA